MSSGPQTGGVDYLSTISLVDFMNPALQLDQGFVAMAESLDPFIQAFLQAIPLNQVICNVPNQLDNVLDYIALYHYNVDNYNTSLPIAQKIQLILNVIIDKIDKGTPQGIYDVLNQNFGDAATLIEWFQDAPPISPWRNAQAPSTPPAIGDANTFRIETTISDPTILNQATQGILTRKNVRSYFAGFIQLITVLGDLYISGQLGFYSYEVITNASRVPIPPPIPIP